MKCWHIIGVKHDPERGGFDLVYDRCGSEQMDGALDYPFSFCPLCGKGLPAKPAPGVSTDPS